MKTIHKRFIAIIFVLLFAPVTRIWAESAPGGLLIVELQTGGAGSGTASQEFVELFNTTDHSVDITGWKLQYRAASKLPTDTWPATSATTIACSSGAADCKVMLAGHGRAVLATSVMAVPGALSLNGGFADAGGQIRLIDSLGAVSDFIGYGTAADFETSAALKPAGGESLKRKVDLNGAYVDTNNNLLDFTLACGQPSPIDNQPILAGTTEGCPLFVLPEPEPTPPTEPEPPASNDAPPVDPDPTPPANNEEPNIPPTEEPTDPLPPSSEPEQPPVNTPGNNDTPPATTPPEVPIPPATPPEEPTLLPLEITEVFPDPASPQTDANDEFVEIYNPNEQPINLSGYTLKTGDAFQHIVTLPGVSIGAKSYFIISSASSTLSLVNTGTGIQLVDQTGSAVSEAPNYQQSKAGFSWAKSQGEWQWSTTVTPNAENVITLPVVDDPPTPTTDDPPTGNQDPQQDPEPQEPTYLQVFITEILPDPTSPAQDDTDEFIEIYNPNQETVNLKDYQLQSGTNYRYKYILPDITIAPGGYLAIVSEESGLVLSNSGTTVRILNPAGETIDELANYGKATEGQSWSMNGDGAWQWSTTLTPGQANSITLLAPKPVKAATAKKPTAKKATTTKPKVASATKTNPAGQEDQVYEETSDQPPTNYWLLAGVGVLAAGYGVYEYRQGITNGARKLWHMARGKNSSS